MAGPQPASYDQYMAQVHMTEAEVLRDFASALDRVKSGAEIVIECDAQPVAVLRPAQPKRRKLSEILASLPQESTARIDPEFAADLQRVIDLQRDPLNPPDWD